MLRASQRIEQFVRWPLMSTFGTARLFSQSATVADLYASSTKIPPSQLRSTAPVTVSLHAARRAYSTHVPTSSLLSYKTLPNGIRVAGEETPGHFSALGVYINAGSRFERPSVLGESGVSHLLDRLAFKSTNKHSTDYMTTKMQQLGGNFMAASSRETIMYQGSMFNQDVAQSLGLLADTVLDPALDPAELDMLRPAVEWEVYNIRQKPDHILPEVLHEVAYKDNTLGNPLLCPEESLTTMTTDNIRDFMKSWYTPERIVIAGAGMPFNQLYELSEELFGGLESVAKRPSLARSRNLPYMRSSSAASPSADFSTTASLQAKHLEYAHLALRPELAKEHARYTGGERFLRDEEQEFTHIYVAFESMSILDEDVYALSVLQMLLGGGGSFSAGGPGKGMYSRLYSNVLNQRHAVDYCAAFHHCYADTGLFGIAMSVDPVWTPYVANVLIRELESVCNPRGRGGVSEEELSRAKNQLKSSLMMSLESRLVEVEDLGRQVQVNGRKVTVEEMCQKIDQVDMDILGRVARRVIQPSSSGEVPLNGKHGSGQSTVVAMGKNLGPLENIRSLFASRGLGAP